MSLVYVMLKQKALSCRQKRMFQRQKRFAEAKSEAMTQIIQLLGWKSDVATITHRKYVAEFAPKDQSIIGKAHARLIHIGRFRVIKGRCTCACIVLKLLQPLGFQGFHGRHGYSIHETLFEEISFGRPKSNAMKNMFCCTF